jgi:putative endonuclease
VKKSAQCAGHSRVGAGQARFMTIARQSLGRRAEGLVADRLRSQGWRIVARNVRTRFGEIDLIGLDRGVLVFVEVKAGRTGARAGPERPALAVGPAKRRRLRALARAWLAGGGDVPRFREVRFDVVGVSFEPGGDLLEFDHIRAAF